MVKVKVTVTTMDGEVLDYIIVSDESTSTDTENKLAQAIVNSIEHHWDTETD